jgi:hypothetical protein
VGDASSRYVAAARRLLDAIGGESAVAGGMAVSAHGYPRSTADVDVVTSIPLAEARRRLRRDGIDAHLRRGDVLEGDIPCVSGRVSRIPFDVIPALVPIGSTEIEVAGHRIRIVDADTLIGLKLKAGSVKDLYDLAILSHVDARFRERAQALAVSDPILARRLNDLVDDPRTRRQAAELRRSRRLPR